MLFPTLLVALCVASVNPGDAVSPPVAGVPDEGWVFHESWSAQERGGMMEVAGEVESLLREADEWVDTGSFEARFWHLIAPAVRRDVVAMVRETARTGDVRLESSNRMSLLWCAMFTGHRALARSLVLRGADVNARCLIVCPPIGEKDILAEGESPFGMAFSPFPGGSAAYAGEEVELVRLMLDHGAMIEPSPGMPYSYLEQALIFSGVRGWKGVDIADLLLGRGALIHPEEAGKVMMCAVRSGSVRIVQELMERGVDINSKYDGAPVWAAVNFRQPHSVAMLQWLLDHGVDTSLEGVPAFYGGSASHPFLFHLVERSVALRDGEVRLHEGVQERALAMADAFLKKEGDVDCVSNRKTPLFVCCERLGGQSRPGDFAVRMARLMLDHGADASFAPCSAENRELMSGRLDAVPQGVRDVLPELWRK